MKSKLKNNFRLLLLILIVGAFSVNVSGQSGPKFHKVSSARAVAGEYIVVLNDSAHTMASAAVDDAVTRLTTLHHGIRMHTYKYALKGFSVRLTEAEAIKLSQNSEVKYVEENAIATTSAVQSPADWGLDRMDQIDRPLNNSFDDKNVNGMGVNVYVIDSGIRTTHTEFGGRASLGADFIGDGLNGQDGLGHGTHVAATIGGATYGVAKKVHLYSVRVINSSNSGTAAGTVAGVDWVTQNHLGPSVANMSIGFTSVVQSVDDAVKGSIAAGVVYVIAAGNSGVDASTTTPAGVGEAITVAACDINDARSIWASPYSSNYGAIVDLYAPGTDITSAFFTSDTATQVLSGTSMAAPHVAGMVARYLQTHPAAAPATVQSYIVSTASLNKVANNVGATPNRLAFMGGPTFTTQPNSQSVTAGSSVTFTATASGTTTVAYQWQKNGVNIASATGNSYTIAPVGGGDAGSFTVIATDSVGSAISNTATLTVSGTPAVVRSDFNGDGKGDILLSNTVTGDRSMWLMNGSTVSNGGYLGTIGVEWVPSGTGDFNGDGKADIIWTNTNTGERSIWLMNGTTVITGGSLGVVPLAWVINGTGDFNGDGKTDVVLSNTVTGDRVIWLMNGTTIATNAFVNTTPVAWVISGTGDFNGDGKADILLSNTVTGDRSMWLMNGSTVSAGAYLTTVPVEWVVSGTDDFNGDGKADVIWTNTNTGERSIWLMNGTTISTGSSLGIVPVAWVINGVRDFNGDGKADVILSNTTTGDRVIWLMNGTTIATNAFVNTTPVAWVISR